MRVAVFFFSHKQASLVYIRYMSWDGFPMFLHCIRSLHFLTDVSDFFFFFFDSVLLYILVYVHYMSWDVFPMYLHCIRSLRFLRVAVFFSHKQASLVYNRYMSWDGFPMFLHCIRSLHFLKDVSDLCIFLFSSAV